MSIGYQKALAATLTLTALVAWTATSTGETYQGNRVCDFSVSCDGW
jgi:hypothetical protein